MTLENWDIDKVVEWLSLLGMEGYSDIFKTHLINGEVLLSADHEMLKELEVGSVGHRLKLLKAIYNLKMEHGIPVKPGDYVPEDNNTEIVTGSDESLYRKIKLQGINV